MRNRRPVQNALLVLMGLTLGLGVSEAMLRTVYRAPWYMQLQARRRTEAMYRLNQLRLRDRDYPPKPPSTRRVLVLGDSFTFGLGVADDSVVFPRVLERMLNQATAAEKAPHIEVLNGGLPGSLTGDWVSLLGKVTESFNPDVVLVVFFLRDGTRITTIKDFFGPIRDQIVRRNRESRWYRYFFSYRLVRDKVDRRRVADLYGGRLNSSYFGTPTETEEWRLAQENVLQLARSASGHSAVMGLAIFPILVNLDDHYPFQAICDTIAAFAVKNSIPTYNLLRDFKGYDGPELWVSAFDQHPNERGHAIAARGLLPFVQQLLTLARERRTDSASVR